MTHFTLKSWSHFFQAIERGDKKHDLRDNSDRKFAVGDTITLREYDPFLGQYSGKECDVVITYITSRDTPCAFSSSVLDRNFCILSLEVVNWMQPLPAETWD
jgi:hypothetical protein